MGPYLGVQMEASVNVPSGLSRRGDTAGKELRLSAGP